MMELAVMLLISSIRIAVIPMSRSHEKIIYFVLFNDLCDEIEFAENFSGKFAKKLLKIILIITVNRKTSDQQIIAFKLSDCEGQR